VSTLPSINDADALTRTRLAWHTLAEHVLAPARHRATGRIGLRAVPGGFGTPPYDVDGHSEELHVVGRSLLVRRAGVTTTVPLTTIADAAATVGIAPGAPNGVYPPTTPLEPDEPLDIDEDAARALGAWFDVTWGVLEELRVTAPEQDAAAPVQLWPEHFDAATELGNERRGTRGTFGASPGDESHPMPYLYVTHWADVADHTYWNDATFPGASLRYEALRRADDPAATALAFFREGRARLNALPG
jgi:hypothetical protein